MNDTILNSRQKTIIDIFSKEKGLSREELALKLKPSFDVSKITLVRDLTLLAKLGYLEINSKGPATTYFQTPKVFLLAPTSLNTYFSKDVDVRELKNDSSSKDITPFLESLFSDVEKELFDTGKEKFLSGFSTLDSTTIKKELERFVIDLSWKSSKIEGNTYSLLETEQLIKDHKEAAGHPKEEAVMILNHKKTFDYILKNKDKEKGSFKKITVRTLREIHSLMVGGLSIQEGFRKHPVGITGTSYKPLDNIHQIEEALEDLFKHVNSLELPFEKALVLLTMISYLQPFADGNKRTARMLCNAILISYGYFPLSYRNVAEIEYKKAMILFYEQNNLFHVKRLFMEQYLFAMENYFNVG